MSGPRLVIVTRRFWPLIGGSEVMVGRLATALHDRGARVTVLTAHWQSEWPIRFDDQGIEVVRLQPPGDGWWSTARYAQRLGRWLHESGPIDLVYCVGLRHEAHAAMVASRRSGFPVVLRCERAGLSGDCHWQLEAACGRRIKRRCYRAAALVAPTPLVHRELIAAGYPRDRIHPIAKGVPVSTPRSAADRAKTRQALAESDPRLAAADDALVALTAGPLESGRGIEALLEAFGRIVAERPTARLWILGEGPLRSTLSERLMWLRLADSVALPGAFDDVSDFLRAADVYVHPPPDDDVSLAALEAMGAGLPVVACDTPVNRSYIDDGTSGRLAKPGVPSAMAEAIISAAATPQVAEKLGSQGRRTVVERYSLGQCVEEHLALFTRVAPAFAPLQHVATVS